MIAAINAALGLDLPAEDYETTGVDNVADAAAVLLLGLSQHARGLTAGA